MPVRPMQMDLAESDLTKQHNQFLRPFRQRKRFFSSRGMSVRTKDIGEAARAAVMLANDRKAAERMRKAQAENAHADAADRVIGYVCGERD